MLFSFQNDCKLLEGLLYYIEYCMHGHLWMASHEHPPWILQPSLCHIASSIQLT